MEPFPSQRGRAATLEVAHVNPHITSLAFQAAEPQLHATELKIIEEKKKKKSPI